MNIQQDKQQKEKKKKKKNDKSRSTHFCVGVCKTWVHRNTFLEMIPVHAILKKLRNKCNLKWSRMSMSHHKFTNPGEIFQGDLNDKPIEGITFQDFMDSKCNCMSSTLVNGKCICGPWVVRSSNWLIIAL